MKGKASGGPLLLRMGLELEQAKGAVILLHGRGGSAEDMLVLARELHHPELAYLAPEAEGHSWYPESFMAPIEENEPWLSASLKQVHSVVRSAVSAGLASERILLCGFSQGACLATEFVARNPQRYAGLIAFTGGMIGPPGADLRHAGDLAATPVLLSSGDPDPHVPWSRVEESARVLEGMNAEVQLRRYSNRPHTISPEELVAARQMLTKGFAVELNDRQASRIAPR